MEVQREAPARLRTELQELTEEANCVKEDRSRAVFEATKAREQLKKSEEDRKLLRLDLNNVRERLALEQQQCDSLRMDLSKLQEEQRRQTPFFGPNEDLESQLQVLEAQIKQDI